jgi:hypothetical protein
LPCARSQCRNSPRQKTRPSESLVGYRWSEPQLYDIFKPDGTYIGRVQPNEGALGHAVRGDTVWYAWMTDDNVPVVRRYIIRWPD